MALLTPAPATTLGRVAREEQAAAREAKRHSSWWRRIVKSLAVTFIALFGALGIGGGTAQAWPWDDLVTAVYYICGPMNVPEPVTYRGFDTALGLNQVDSNQRHTIVPKIGDDLAGNKGNGLERLSKAYGSGRDAQIIAKPTYERYGFSSLVWTNYGNGCASKAFWLSGVTNFAFDIFVKFPMILGMGLLEWTMDPDNVLFKAFGEIVQPIAGVFGAILQPWIFFVAPVGVFVIWLRTRSTVQVTKAFVWVVCIYGLFAWLTGVTTYGGGNGWEQSDNPGRADPSQIAYPDEAPEGVSGGLARVTNFGSNFVTTFAGNAACKISEVSAGGQACDPNNPMGNIHESLWHGVPLEVWMAGELGEQTAEESRRLEAQGQIGWHGAILNGMYVGNDDKGHTVSKAINHWNKGSYAADNTDHDAKVGFWTGGDANKPEWSDGAAWEDVPFLANIKFMCNDTAVDDDGSGEEEHNKWMYGGNCDAAGAGTADMVPYFKGEGYSQQIVYAFAGAWAVIAIVLTIGLACIYLMVQKMLFFWLLAFGPVFLAISTFADQKRRAFAKRWFELLVANVLKQCVAVLVVLFVSYSMAALVANNTIPWIVKPYAAILAMIAMIMFARPMANIAKAAVAGDTSVVDKTASAPQRAAANTAKAAAVAGAVAATGGLAAAAAPAAGGVLSGTTIGGAAKSALSNPQTLRAMGRMAGRGVVGKGLHGASAIAGWRQSQAATAAQREGQARAERAGVEHLLNGPDASKYRDKDGNVTAAGLKSAKTDFKKQSALAEHEGKVKSEAQQSMQKFFEGHRLSHGGKHHPADPDNPENRNRQKTDEHVPGRPMSEHMAGRVHEAHEGPSYARDPDQQVVAAETGEAVLGGLGLTLSQAVDNPAALVTGDAYAGGHTEQMDPNHPAFPALTALRFAVDAGTDEDAQRLALDASSAIAGAGSVPAHVSSAYSTGDLAEQWHPAQTIGAMPDLTPAEDGTSIGFEDRAAAAVTMAQAAALIPEGHEEARAAVDAYVSALSSPKVDLGTVDVLGVAAIRALDPVGPPPSGDGDDGDGGPQPPPPGDSTSYEPDSPPADPVAGNGHQPDGLGLARDALRRATEGKNPSPNGDQPRPDAEEKPSRDVPRGEGTEPVTEYNAPKRKRSGIFGYDDEPGEEA